MSDSSYAGDLTPVQTWELLSNNPDAVLVDIRSEGEWRATGVPDTSSIGHATHLIEWITALGPNPNFVADLAEAGIDANVPVLFICRSGGRSIGAAQDATAAGYNQAFNVSQGLEGDLDTQGGRTVNGWHNAGMPTTTYPSGPDAN